MILPLVAELLGRVRRHPAVEASLEALRDGRGAARLAGLIDPAKALVGAVAGLGLGRPVVFVVESTERAEALAEPLRFFYRALAGKPAVPVAVLPAYDVLPYQGLSPHPQIAADRAVALWQLSTGAVSIVLAPLGAALGRLRPAEFYRGLARGVARDDALALDHLVGHLGNVGYEPAEMVEMPGQYAVRGGIVDVFSPNAIRPVRIELFGDTVESLREFDPGTQRSTGPVEKTTLLPLTEWSRGEAGGEPSGGLAPGWEFRPGPARRLSSSLFELAGDPAVLLDEPETLDQEARRLRERVAAAYEAACRGNASTEAGNEPAEPASYVLDDAAWQRQLERRPRLLLEQLGLERGERSSALPTQPTLRYHGNVAAFLGEARSRLEAGSQVIVSAATTGELERLADLCREYELPHRLGERAGDSTTARLAEEAGEPGAAAVVLLKTPLVQGVVFPDLKLVLYGNADLFETAAPSARPLARAKAASFSSDFSDLKQGDLVVHVDHGIGEFEGLRQITVDSSWGEFMLLRYAEEARLYVPLARLDLVQKYRALGGTRPLLDRLGGATWSARKQRVRKSVDEMAERLLRLYAARKAESGHAYPEDSPWQKEFEDAFEFEETPDQARAIEEVKRDLQSPAVTDRLLCGDVGYGKTEVAIRAAFKVVSESRQVAVLAPTTVLAFQHYETFRRRLAAFPVRIAMLSRFRSAREQKKVIEELAAGQADIVIGTHRLLSSDVHFHDLGLLVIDEEQRFGVAHKERLKEMKRNVDVLAMSATPIPRTLHMSLMGLRDMSLIETPPKDRLAIQTVVAPFSEELVRRVIEEEVGRRGPAPLPAGRGGQARLGGQVYFVHNRVESIHSMAALVRRLVPRARVVVAHGQMPEKELEQVMLQFIRHEADVLVSTSIIENGLDIPNANTIVINRADRFGLADLYQLRGRVGRSNQRAYAYLLVPPAAQLSATARQRLAALKEFSELGAGFRIAALDLELRGAGNLLGREQHGAVNAVGFDLYCQMLERAVAEGKGEPVRPALRTALNLGLDIRIPPDYIPGEGARLRTYKRIAGVETEDQREQVRQELEDRFGPPPRAVENLLDYALLKALAEKLLVASIERRQSRLAIKFHGETPVRPEQLVRLVESLRSLRLDPAGMLWVEWKRDGDGAGPAAVARNVLLQLQP
jgi:transcription-repair coupling factor (superfamily II helicase)